MGAAQLALCQPPARGSRRGPGHQEHHLRARTRADAEQERDHGSEDKGDGGDGALVRGGGGRRGADRGAGRPGRPVAAQAGEGQRRRRQPEQQKPTCAEEPLWLLPQSRSEGGVDRSAEADGAQGAEATEHSDRAEGRSRRDPPQGRRRGAVQGEEAKDTEEVNAKADDRGGRGRAWAEPGDAERPQPSEQDEGERRRQPVGESGAGQRSGRSRRRRVFLQVSQSVTRPRVAC